MLLSNGGDGPATAAAAQLSASAGHAVHVFTYPGSAAASPSLVSHELEIEHLKTANRYLMRANKSMHRSWPRRQLATDNALRRDSWIARWTHRIYIIGLFTQDASLLKIGTDCAWSAQMYVDRFLYDQEPWALCELFLFDMKSECWWQWQQQWARTDQIPTPEGVYTILGLDKMNTAGKTALKSLYRTAAAD